MNIKEFLKSYNCNSLEEFKRIKLTSDKFYEIIDDYLTKCTYNQKFQDEQKEFIEYLEDKLNMCYGFLDTIKSDLEEISYAGRALGKTYIATQIMKNETAMKCYEEVLSKYKEIIGGKHE